jgi:hypothetical protein
MKMTVEKFLDKDLGPKQVKVDNKKIFDALKQRDKLGILTYEDIENYQKKVGDVYYVNAGFTRIGNSGGIEVVELDLEADSMEEILLKEIFNQEDKVEFSFRFNEERKSVTLYKNGEKVQFVKCHEEDKFSWKIGLGVAFYKELFGKGTAGAPASIKYVEGILNWKMFYTYILAYALDFDEHKLERLDKRVKSAKLYKEIKIND